MSFNRNKNEDRMKTRKMLNKQSIKLFTPKSWLDHSGAAGKIDQMLLYGATFDELLSSGRKPNSVYSHLHHLKAEHGLPFNNVDGLYSFSGMPKSSNDILVFRKSNYQRPPNSVPKTRPAYNPDSSPGKQCAVLPVSKTYQEQGSKEKGKSIDKEATRNRLIEVVSTLAVEKRLDLEKLKQEQCGLDRSDFIWHYLLQSFSTMGRASGWHGLIGDKSNYQRVTYNVLAAFSPEERRTQVQRVCREAGIRMPDKKADYILRCFDYVKLLGGPEIAKAKLLAQPGREAKIHFLQTFPGIGPKYARNIMMDVYHEDFRNSIALDVRIKAISEALGLSFSSYAEHESFYLKVAKEAGINGWELDRLLFNFREEVELHLGVRITS